MTPRTVSSASRSDAKTQWTYFLLGCAILLPFNALFNATSFFLSRLAGSPYYPTFSSYLSSTYTWTKLLCQFYCTFTLKQSSPSRRIFTSVTAMFLLITLLCSSTFVRSTPWTFCVFALANAACMAVASSYLCTAVYAGAALIGAPCLRAVLSGQAAIAVTVSAVQVASSMIALWGSSSNTDLPEATTTGRGDDLAEEIAARIFFGVAAVFLLIALVAYAWSTRQSSHKATAPGSEDACEREAPNERTALVAGARSTDSTSHIYRVFGNNFVFLFSIAFVFTLTLAVYPTITARVRPVNPSFHPLLFTAVHFLAVNTGGFLGQHTCSYPRLVVWSGKKILTMSLLRTLFIPLLLLCNIDRLATTTTTTLSIVRSDILYMIIVLAMGYTHGYVLAAALLAVSSLERNPRLKGRQDVDVVATLGSSCMILGLAMGSLSSFGVQALI